MAQTSIWCALSLRFGMLPSHNSDNSFLTQETIITGPRVEGTYIHQTEKVRTQDTTYRYVLNLKTEYPKQKMNLPVSGKKTNIGESLFLQYFD